MSDMTRLDQLLIGTSTAAIQIEGGDKNNNWYDWSQLPGNIKDGSTPLRATDHWNRWREDTELMAELGLSIYRMSLEWSRLEPRPGEFDDAAFEHYRNELGLLQEKGIRPLITLHHFTNPSWFQGLGEFTRDDNIALWLDFVREAVTRLGDLCSDWVTLNEPNVYVTAAHLFREGPPADVSLPRTMRAMRVMALAHCRAYRLIKELQPESMVGLAHHMRSFTAMNPRNPLHQGAAKLSSYLFQDALTDALLGGRFRGLFGPQPADIAPGSYYDYLGLNYYSRTASKGLTDGTVPGSPINDLGWEIYPQGLIECARWMYERYPAPIWVTENGTCDNGNAATGDLERFRTRFLDEHLTAIADSGLPFERYYHWCFVDNWEWMEGEVPRFGIVANDYETQQRTIKPSGRFLARIIADGGITPAARAEFVEGHSYPVLS